MTKPSSSVVSRRAVFAGVGAAGALAAVATVVPQEPAVLPVSPAAAKPAQGGGYHLSEHVKQYYASART